METEIRQDVHPISPLTDQQKQNMLWRITCNGGNSQAPEDFNAASSVMGLLACNAVGKQSRGIFSVEKNVSTREIVELIAASLLQPLLRVSQQEFPLKGSNEYNAAVRRLCDVAIMQKKYFHVVSVNAPREEVVVLDKDGGPVAITRLLYKDSETNIVETVFRDGVLGHQWALAVNEGFERLKKGIPEDHTWPEGARL